MKHTSTLQNTYMYLVLVVYKYSDMGPQEYPVESVYIYIYIYANRKFDFSHILEISIQHSAGKAVVRVSPFPNSEKFKQRSIMKCIQNFGPEYK